MQKILLFLIKFNFLFITITPFLSMKNIKEALLTILQFALLIVGVFSTLACAYHINVGVNFWAVVFSLTVAIASWAGFLISIHEKD